MTSKVPEPVLLRTPPTPGSAQDDSPTRSLSPSLRLGDPGRRIFTSARRFGRRQRPGLRQARSPFDRLTFYSVGHELVHRLKPYEVTDLPLMFRGSTWATLVYWAELLEEVEAPREDLVSA